MDNDKGSVAAAADALASTTATSFNSSPDDDLDEAAAAAAVAASEATRDTLADGLVARMLRPCVDRLDASVQCTRLSQLDLKLQLDSLATELKRLSLAQHEYLFASMSISSQQSSAADDKTVSSAAAATAKTATDMCTLLDGYARRLCGARAKIAVVGNILESTQERLRALSHRIGREHNNRRSLLEPQTGTGGAVVTPELDDNDVDKLEYRVEDVEMQQQTEEQKQSVDHNTVITSQAESELSKLS